MARNRVIYQSQALYMAPSSTGYHLQTGGGAVGGTGDVADSSDWQAVTGFVTGPVGAGFQRSLLEPLHRIQSANFNFTINRQDINEFGRLARLDSIVMESPTVGLDFNYYLTDGGNERLLGFNIPTNSYTVGRNGSSATFQGSTGDGCISGASAISGLIADPQGNNFFIVTSKEGDDVQGDTISDAATAFDVISIGNGFISDYSLDASVGAIPTASVTVEAFNIKVDDYISGDQINSNAADQNQFPLIPAVDEVNGQKQNNTIFMVQGKSNAETTLNTTGQFSDMISALRPGDITFEMSNSGNYQGFADFSGDGKCHLQSFGVSVPMSRTVLGRLGNTFGYARVIDLPMDVSVSISAIVSELEKNNVFDALSNTQKHDFTLTLARANTSTGGKGDSAMVIKVKGARLDSESYSASIGDNETVDITFTTQVGGSSDTSNGIFMEGTYDRFRTVNYWPLGEAKKTASKYSGVPTTPS